MPKLIQQRVREWKAEQSRKVPQVITHAGWQDPTPKQVSYLNHLATQLGERPPKVTTLGGASRAIDRLQERVRTLSSSSSQAST